MEAYLLIELEGETGVVLRQAANLASDEQVFITYLFIHEANNVDKIEWVNCKL